MGPPRSLRGAPYPYPYLDPDTCNEFALVGISPCRASAMNLWSALPFSLAEKLPVLVFLPTERT